MLSPFVIRSPRIKRSSLKIFKEGLLPGPRAAPGTANDYDNYDNRSSVTAMIDQLRQRTLEQRRSDARLCLFTLYLSPAFPYYLLYKGSTLYGVAWDFRRSSNLGRAYDSSSIISRQPALLSKISK